jgi:hypothetical protein
MLIYYVQLSSKNTGLPNLYEFSITFNFIIVMTLLLLIPYLVRRKAQ